MVSTVAGGNEDLLTIEDVLVTVELGGGAHGCGVGTEIGLGDGHCGPDLAEVFELLVSCDGGDSGVTQALVRNREGQSDVTPAHFNDVEQ